MKRYVITTLVSVLLIIVISAFHSGHSVIKITPSLFSDTIVFPGEKHFANVQQLTFGGDNAEAYFSSTTIIIVRLESSESGICRSGMAMDCCIGF